MKESEENAGQKKSGSQSQESSKPDQPMEGSADDLVSCKAYTELYDIIFYI